MKDDVGATAPGDFNPVEDYEGLRKHALGQPLRCTRFLKEKVVFVRYGMAAWMNEGMSKAFDERKEDARPSGDGAHGVSDSDLALVPEAMELLAEIAVGGLIQERF